MLNRRFVTMFGIFGLIVMTALLVVVWFRLVPTDYYVPLFAFAFVIWATRLTMRVMLARKERRELDSGTPDSVLRDPSQKP